MADAVEGAVLHGPDGSVYFIPAGDLEAYKVDDASAEAAKQALGGGGEAERGLGVLAEQASVGRYLGQAGQFGTESGTQALIIHGGATGHSC